MGKYDPDYYAANREHVKAYNDRWRKSNPEKIKAKDKAYYEANSEAIKAKVSAKAQEHRDKKDEVYLRRLARQSVYSEKRRQEGRDIILAHKLANPCSCGESNPDCLVFHHRDPNEKEEGVTRMISFGRQKLLAEIEKCDVLCSNCHLKLHARLRREQGLDPH